MRIPELIIFQDKSRCKDTCGGSLDFGILQGHHLKPVTPISRTVVIFMHPFWWWATRPRNPVCQSPLESASEHRLVYPRDEYEMIVGLPDELVTESTRDIVPSGKSG